MGNGSMEIFCFTMNDLRLAIPLRNVNKVIMAVAVTTVPNVPPIFYGIINNQGKAIPVINLYHRFNLTKKDISPEQVFIIADTSERQIALVADKTEGVMKPENEDVFSVDYLNQSIEANGVLCTNKGIIFIYDIEKFLQADEIIQFDKSFDNKMT
ncbi:MAG: chemotaxis protein CheW [Bacteroidales bacterium]|nr:chemotaxis protein CheW [Bacteroidales bacterium]